MHPQSDPLIVFTHCCLAIMGSCSFPTFEMKSSITNFISKTGMVEYTSSSSSEKMSLTSS
uniref:Uncharacterized protein n=1 Tax=Megaselia scalaris TaxID=36166 RepID=T1GCH2_MEGSC